MSRLKIDQMLQCAVSRTFQLVILQAYTVLSTEDVGNYSRLRAVVRGSLFVVRKRLRLLYDYDLWKRFIVAFGYQPREIYNIQQVFLKNRISNFLQKPIFYFFAFPLLSNDERAAIFAAVELRTTAFFVVRKTKAAVWPVEEFYNIHQI